VKPGTSPLCFFSRRIMAISSPGPFFWTRASTKGCLFCPPLGFVSPDGSSGRSLGCFFFFGHRAETSRFPFFEGPIFSPRYRASLDSLPIRVLPFFSQTEAFLHAKGHFPKLAFFSFFPLFRQGLGFSFFARLSDGSGVETSFVSSRGGAGGRSPRQGGTPPFVFGFFFPAFSAAERLRGLSPLFRFSGFPDVEPFSFLFSFPPGSHLCWKGPFCDGREDLRARKIQPHSGALFFFPLFFWIWGPCPARVSSLFFFGWGSCLKKNRCFPFPPSFCDFSATAKLQRGLNPFLADGRPSRSLFHPSAP